VAVKVLEQQPKVFEVVHGPVSSRRLHLQVLLEGLAGCLQSHQGIERSRICLFVTIAVNEDGIFCELSSFSRDYGWLFSFLLNMVSL
jgi:hypothetical protein